MSRVRRLNVSNVTAGFATPTYSPGPTGAWDLETDLEPRFTKRRQIQLYPMSSLVPLPGIVPRGWSVMTEMRARRRPVVTVMPFVSVVPVPYVILTTSSATLAGNFQLNFVSVPATLPIGMYIYDLTTAGRIPAGTTVVSIGPTTVIMSAAAIGGGVLLGDRIKFTW